jgi:uncharacterized protein (TIGR02646 family)
MHFVNRGQEPPGLVPIRLTYTQAWIDHYNSGIGKRPTDKRWIDFIDQLSASFAGCCGYCETRCKGVVDHLRPKSKFPDLVYEWHNWVFSCHDCNQNKRSHWPSSGFLDPCSASTFCGTQSCFAFDLKTGEVLPNPRLPAANRACARTSIEILGLNLSFRLKARLDHISSLDTLLDLAEHSPRRAAKKLARLTLPDAPLCSLTQHYLAEHLF